MVANAPMVQDAPHTVTTSVLVCSPGPEATGGFADAAAAANTFTKTWEANFLAACTTSAWDATYTITAECTGAPDAWTRPAFPPNFVVTTVTCDSCAEPTMTITCPNALGTDRAVINGNGVTATVEPSARVGHPHGRPAGGSGGGGGAADSSDGSSDVSGGGSGGAPAGDKGGDAGKPGSKPAVVTAGSPPMVDGFSLKKGATVLAGLGFIMGVVMI